MMKALLTESSLCRLLLLCRRSAKEPPCCRLLRLLLRLLLLIAGSKASECRGAKHPCEYSLFPLSGWKSTQSAVHGKSKGGKLK